MAMRTRDANAGDGEFDKEEDEDYEHLCRYTNSARPSAHATAQRERPMLTMLSM
jgi:hypothetical protein